MSKWGKIQVPGMDGSIKPMDPMVAPFKPGDFGEPIVGAKGQPDKK